MRELLSGQTIPDELRDKILSRGPIVVPELVDALKDDGWAAIHAVELLVDLRATAAIEPLLDLLEETEWDDIVHDLLIRQLGLFEDAIVEPALRRVGQDPDLDGALAEILSSTGVKSDAIFAVINGVLDEDVLLGAGLFADYGDPEALPILEETFDELEISDDPLVFTELRYAIEQLGGKLDDKQTEKLLRATGKLPDRNAPCWCKSGKKYKQCHYQQPA